ncbi:MAG: hypothetical protein M1833_006323 [Piccolia ochrophora]|nr:MAG: hypothetical protein M1833_006323 [Piccolia ochrophora]
MAGRDLVCHLLPFVGIIGIRSAFAQEAQVQQQQFLTTASGDITNTYLQGANVAGVVVSLNVLFDTEVGVPVKCKRLLYSLNFRDSTVAARQSDDSIANLPRTGQRPSSTEQLLLCLRAVFLLLVHPTPSPLESKDLLDTQTGTEQQAYMETRTSVKDHELLRERGRRKDYAYLREGNGKKTVSKAGHLKY